MPNSFKFTPVALSTYLLIFAAPSSANQSVADIDIMRYELGGGTVPAFTSSIPLYGRYKELFKVSVSGDNSCSNFDPTISIKNSFTQSAGRVKKMLKSIPDAVKSSLNPASLAAAALQRSSPQTYEQMMQGISIGFEDYNKAKNFCEQIQGKILDQIPSGAYNHVAQSEFIKNANSALKKGHQIDVVDIFGGKDSNQAVSGDSGINTPRGRRGGVSQPPFYVNETAEYGYEKLTGMIDEDATLPVSGLRPKTLNDYFKNQSELKNYVDKVVGSVAIRTCNNCESYESVPGVGLSALVGEDSKKFYNLLMNLVNKNIATITSDDLNDASVFPLLNVSLSIIKVLQSESFEVRSHEIAGLSYDLATAENIQKAGYAKMALIAGKSSPEVAGNEPIGKDVDALIELLDAQIQTVLTQNEISKNLAQSTSLKILKRNAIESKHLELPVTTPVVKD